MVYLGWKSFSLFKDVTHAYKSLLEEKKALEITIKALKTKNIQSVGMTTAVSGSSTSLSSNKQQSDASEAEQSGGEQLRKVNADASNEEKIAALTSNIQLVLEYKSRLEQSYQAEKKKLRVWKLSNLNLNLIYLFNLRKQN